MPNTAIAQALSRQAERPDIHKKVDKIKGRTGYPQSVADMVLDLKATVPELSLRQLSSLVGISKDAVSAALDNSEPMENWTADDNEGSSRSELIALCECHPDRQYEDHPDAKNEHTGPVLFTAPQPVDHHRRANQSHATKRPITLPQFPFLPLKTRYAA